MISSSAGQNIALQLQRKDFAILVKGGAWAFRVGFVRYDEKSKSWLLSGSYDLNRETVLRLAEAISGLRRNKLAPDEFPKKPQLYAKIEFLSGESFYLVLPA